MSDSLPATPGAVDGTTTQGQRAYSPASDFAPAPDEKTITLPVDGPNGPLDVLLRRLSIREVQSVYEGLPDMLPPTTPDESGGQWERASAVCEKLARLGIKGPEFSFDEREADRAFWPDLHETNQIAIGMELLAMAGLGGAGIEAGSFLRGLTGGRRGSARDDGAVPAASSPAPTSEQS